MKFLTLYEISYTLKWSFHASARSFNLLGVPQVFCCAWDVFWYTLQKTIGMWAYGPAPGQTPFSKVQKCMKFHTPDITNVRHAKSKNRRSNFVRS